MNEDIEAELYRIATKYVNDLKSHVPVRTGRLRNSIKAELDDEGDWTYTIRIICEDYFAWLKYRKRPSTPPTSRELDMSRPPLPKMNSLGLVPRNELSPRSKGIMESLDMSSIESLRPVVENRIKEILKTLW